MDNNRFNSTLKAGEVHKKEVIDQLNKLINGLRKMITSIEKTGYDDLIISYIGLAAKHDINYIPSISENFSIENLNNFLTQLDKHLHNIQKPYTVENAFELGDNVTSAESFADNLLAILHEHQKINSESFKNALDTKRAYEKNLDEIYEKISSIRRESLSILNTADTIFKKPSYKRKQILKGHSKELKAEIFDNERTRDMLETQINALYLESFAIKRQIKKSSFSPKNYNSNVFSVIDLPSINPKYSDYR